MPNYVVKYALCNFMNEIMSKRKSSTGIVDQHNTNESLVLYRQHLQIRLSSAIFSMRLHTQLVRLNEVSMSFEVP